LIVEVEINLFRWEGNFQSWVKITTLILGEEKTNFKHLGRRKRMQRKVERPFENEDRKKITALLLLSVEFIAAFGWLTKIIWNAE